MSWDPQDRHAVVFDKEFLTGILAGITVTNQRITYPNRAAAEKALSLFGDKPITGFNKSRFIMRNKRVEAINV